MKFQWCFFGQCPLCDRKQLRARYQVDSVKVFQCVSCKLLFLNPYLSSQSMLRAYASTEAMQLTRQCLGHYYDHWEGSQTEKFQQWILDTIGRFRSPGSLLDVGCGRGHFLSLARRLGWKVQGLEPAQEHAEYGKRKEGLEIVSAPMEEADFEAQRFDVISLWDVIEHVHDPRMTLAQLSRWLKSRGLLLLATPNHDSLLNFIAERIYLFSGGLLKKPLSFFYVPEHILYFTPDTLRQLVEGCGFRVLKEIKTGTDIDRYKVSKKVKWVAKVLLGLARLLHAENRVVMICEKN